MSTERFLFATFELDPKQRRLTDEGVPVELSGRYFDALHLLVAEAGSLVTKDRFHADVWRGIPVTDEALTQCVRSLRKALGDDAATPRFIETVPKHGYRFVAPVRIDAPPVATALRRAGPIAAEALAGAMGGGVAGLVGGAIYASTGLVTAGLGAASTMLAFMSLCLLLGILGGVAVGLGIALGGTTVLRSMLGGAAGGLLIGALAGIVGSDLFVLLFGRAPQAFTGPLDSAGVGLATGLAVAIVARWRSGAPLARLAVTLVIGAVAGVAIALAGGRLLAGSLAQLAAAFPESPLRLDGLRAIGISAATTFEAMLFVAFVTAAVLARRRLFGQGAALLSD